MNWTLQLSGVFFAMACVAVADGVTEDPGARGLELATVAECAGGKAVASLRLGKVCPFDSGGLE